MIRTCIILVAAALCNAEGGKYTREANQPVSYHGMLGWGCFFLARCTHSPTQRVAVCIIIFLLINTVTPFSLTACIFFQPPWDVMEIRVGRFNQPFINQDII